MILWKDQCLWNERERECEREREREREREKTVIHTFIELSICAKIGTFTKDKHHQLQGADLKM